MSITYEFEAETHFDIYRSVSQIFEFLDLSPDLKPVNEGSTVIYGNSPHFTIYGHPIDDSEDALTQLLNLSPTVRMNFRVKLSSGNKAEEDILRGTVSWLKAYPGNCALLFNGELVLFVRKAGQISINSNTDFWMPTFLEIFQVPYNKVPFEIL